jgi:hypothetical protein
MCDAVSPIKVAGFEATHAALRILSPKTQDHCDQTALGPMALTHLGGWLRQIGNGGRLTFSCRFLLTRSEMLPYPFY